MKHFVQSPCGHGKLVDVVPHDGWDGAEEEPELQRKVREQYGKQRWGLISVVLRDGEAKQCCSWDEGEYETKEEAEEACEHYKRHTEKGLLDALALLEGAAQTAWSMARVTLDDLFALRAKLIEVGGAPLAASRQACEVALCFEGGTSIWLVDDERTARLCEEHLKGEKVYALGGEEVVFAGWDDYHAKATKA